MKTGLGNRCSIQLSYGAERQTRSESDEISDPGPKGVPTGDDSGGALSPPTDAARNLDGRAADRKWVPLRRKPLDVRHAALTDRSGGPDACWLWMGNVDGDGYGRITANGAMVLAHRVALSLAVGRELRSSEVAMHSCDVRRCQNPAHLSAGSISDNHRDMVAKGRHPRGETHGHSRLTPEQVHEIRSRFDAGERPTAICLGFGVTEACIRRIGERLTWRHLPERERRALSEGGGGR